MERNKRLRRVGILCCHFARNYAYYNAGWSSKGLKVKDQFWVSLNSNFIDISVIEWCKLFGDYKDKHHFGLSQSSHLDYCYKKGICQLQQEEDK